MTLQNIVDPNVCWDRKFWVERTSLPALSGMTAQARVSLVGTLVF